MGGVHVVSVLTYGDNCGVTAKREWIEQGLRHMREREEQLRFASERRLHHSAVIKEKGPDLMRRLVTEVAAVIDEYKHSARADGDEIEFEELPGDGFHVTRARLPRVGLECRPGYETQALHCNMTRTDDHESAPQEFLFNLDIKVDDSDRIALNHEARAFQTLDEVVEFLLKPVLFPVPNDQDV